MKYREPVTGDIYDVWTLDQVETTPNLEVEGEVFVDVVSPAGEEVRMSVVTDNPDLRIVTNDEGYRMIHPNFFAYGFEEVGNG